MSSVPGVEPSGSGFSGLTKREALSLSFLFDGSSTFQAGLLLLQLRTLPFQLLLHLAVSGVQFFLALLQLALLLLDLLLEYHLHLCLHLGELLLVQSSLLLLLDCRVDLLEHAWVLGDSHLGKLLGTVVLVENVVGVLLELFHVIADEHLAELDEIAVLFVVDLDDTPRVATTADLATVRSGDFSVRSNDGKRHPGHNLLVLSNCLLVIELITGALKDLDVVVFDIGEDLYKLNQHGEQTK